MFLFSRHACVVSVLFAVLGCFCASTMAQSPLQLQSAVAFGGSATDEVRGAGLLPDGRALALVEDATSLNLYTLSTEGAPAGQRVAVQRSGAAGVVQGDALSVASDGSSVLAGRFTVAVTLDAGLATETVLSASPGATMGFWAAYAPGGALLWVRALPGVQISSVAAKDGNRCAVYGVFSTTTTFGAGEPNETTLVWRGGDLFLAQCADDGGLEWVRYGYNFPGVPDNPTTSMLALPNGDLLIAGRMQWSATFAADAAETTTLAGTPGTRSAFVARYGSGGALQWVLRPVELAGISSGVRDLALLSNGDFVLYGSTGSAIWFDPDGGSTTPQTILSGGYHDFLVRGRPDGSYMAGALTDGGRLAGLPDGRLLAAGTFTGTRTFGVGQPRETTLSAGSDTAVYLAVLDPELTLAAVVQDGTAPSQAADLPRVLTTGGEVWMLHGFSGQATFATGGGGPEVLVAEGVSDGAAARYREILLPHPGEGPLQFRYAKRAGGIMRDEAYGVAARSDGGAYVTGGFSTMPSIFGPGEPNETVLQILQGEGMFIARYEKNGSLRWARQAGRTFSSVYGTDAAVMADDGVAVVGAMTSGAKFGAGEPGEVEFTSGMGGSIAGFLASYAADGSFRWARRFASQVAPGNAVRVVVLAPGGDIVVTGHFSGNMTLGSGEPNQTTLSGGMSDRFLARYHPDGALAWARRIATTSAFLYQVRLAIAPDGTIYFATEFGSSINFGAETFTASSRAFALAEFDADGNYQWGLASEGDMTPGGFCADADGLLLAGAFSVSATFAGHSWTAPSVFDYSQIFVARVNRNGVLQWSATAGSDSSLQDTIKSAIADGQGGWILHGFVIGPARFSGPDGTFIHDATGAILVRYTSGGSVDWVRNVGGLAEEMETGGGALVMGGILHAPTVWEAATPQEVVLTPAGQQDVFVAAYGAPLPADAPPVIAGPKVVYLIADSGQTPRLLDLSLYAHDDDTPLRDLVFSVLSQTHPEVVAVAVDTRGVVDATVQPGASGRNTVIFSVRDLSNNTTTHTIEFFVIDATTAVPTASWTRLR